MNVCADLADNGRARPPGAPKIMAEQSETSFTLVELLVVVVVILLLAAMVIGTAHFADFKAKHSRATAQMALLDLACELYRQDAGRYPTSGLIRCSMTYCYEAFNASLLYQQLTKYL